MTPHTHTHARTHRTLTDCCAARFGVPVLSRIPQPIEAIAEHVTLLVGTNPDVMPKFAAGGVHLGIDQRTVLFVDPNGAVPHRVPEQSPTSSLRDGPATRRRAAC